MPPEFPRSFCVPAAIAALAFLLTPLSTVAVRGATPGEDGKAAPEAGAAPAKDAPPPGKAENSTASPAPPAFLSIGKGFEIMLYGHLRLDASLDDAETNSGNTAMWVKPDKGKEEANVTARHTRVGFDLKGPRTMGVTPTGKVEIDFYGKESEVQQNVRLRHAFLRFDLGEGFSVLAGQTLDMHGSLFMRTLNTAVGWNHGNLAFRRPQIRLGKELALGGGASLLAEFGVARAIGKINGGDLDGGTATNDDGEDAARPDIQANFTLSLPSLVPKKPVRVMFGGHYGQEFLSTIPRFVGSWSWVSGLSLPVFDGLAFEGELWMGSNVDAYRGGIGQGFDLGTGRAVLSRGGFAQLTAGPLFRLSFCSGFGMDDPYNGHVSPGKPSLNRSFFGNVKLTVCKGGWIGLEYQRFWTDYLRARNAMDNRFQFTLCLKY